MAFVTLSTSMGPIVTFLQKVTIQRRWDVSFFKANEISSIKLNPFAAEAAVQTRKCKNDAQSQRQPTFER